ncbi:hypothetical protein [Reyranella sp.]|uniref:hypothetical protein n=1 Tax=Reyranella sp. TaxID=1929291 RepID=UPI003D0F5F9B
MMKPILICCPTTGINVQAAVPGEPAVDGVRRYDAIDCAACGRIHLVNAATGKLLAEEDKE